MNKFSLFFLHKSVSYTQMQCNANNRANKNLLFYNLEHFCNRAIEKT